MKTIKYWIVNLSTPANYSMEYPIMRKQSDELPECLCRATNRKNAELILDSLNRGSNNEPDELDDSTYASRFIDRNS